MAKQPAQRGAGDQPAATIESLILRPVEHRVSSDFGGMSYPDENLGERFAANLQQQIARRAYELAERRSFAPGHEVEDWLRAEREILSAPMIEG